jgi:hypothetical protein
MGYRRYAAAGFVVAAALALLHRSTSAGQPNTPKIAFAADGETVTLPDGPFELNEPIVITERRNVILRGGKNSNLVYKGPGTPGIVQLIGCSHCVVENFEISNLVDSVGSLVLVTNHPDARPISTSNTVRRIFSTWRDDTREPRFGFSTDSYALGGKDGNNDQHLFDDCVAGNFLYAGFHVKGSQCHQLSFHRCRTSAKRGKYGLWAEDGVFFRWIDGSMHANECDFALGTALTRAVIDGHNSEQSKQLLKTGSTGSQLPLVIRNTRWDGHPTAETPMIDYNPGAGPVEIVNNTFTSLSGVTPWVRLVSYKGVPATAMLKGNLFMSFKENLLPPIVVGKTGWLIEEFGNQRIVVGDKKQTVTPVRVERK